VNVNVPAPKYEPVRFATKAEAVYAEVRRRILSGILEPGARLNQDALAPELGVSVTPVREAVRRLEAEGLVEFEAHKTVIVAQLSRAELRALYDVRLRLDPHAAALATTAASEDVLLEIERMAHAPIRGDAIEQLAFNRSFHRVIYAECGNAILIDILDRLWERTDRYRIVLLRRDIDALAAGREHIEIAEAMRAREPRRVARLIKAHIGTARSLIEDALA
jgi:DNA-binding GntR family transcriptional regulator